MAWSYGEQPPSYFETVRNNDQPTPVLVGIATVTLYRKSNVPTGVLEQTRISEVRQSTVTYQPDARQETRNNRVATEVTCHVTNNRSECRQNTLNRTVVGSLNALNCLKGLLDVLYEEKKLPWSFTTNTIYKLGLFVYYLANFLYSIIAVAVQKDNFAYHIIYLLISTIGALFELIVMIVDVRKYIIYGSEGVEEWIITRRRNRVTHTDQPSRAWTNTQVGDYPHKAKSVLVNYVFLSLGEFLIYPTLICTLYGFVNERAWRFDNGISACNFLFFLYSVIMDGMYLKCLTIFLVIRVVRASYSFYSELSECTEVEWKKYFTPIYLSIPFAVMTALTHWFMTCLLGVRIYVDNFTIEKNDTNSTIPNTGDYRVAGYTGYVISCTIYLPIASWITYIILNKSWFYEVYSAINQLSNGAEEISPHRSCIIKLLIFAKDPLAYIVVLFLMIPFFVFTTAIYLPDYDTLHYEVAPSAIDAVQVLGPCFTFSFLITNFQAVIVTIMIATVVFCVMAVLWTVISYVYSRCSNDC